MTQQMMKAALLHGYGDVNRFSYEDVSMPVPADGEVLVKTIAVSINPIDWKLRRGDLKLMMPINFPAILGRDVSGEVIALGEGVTNMKIGERVFGLVNHSYAEYAVASVRIWLGHLMLLTPSTQRHCLWCCFLVPK
jgi:NADPH:quinone reductase-like Zn-dependent oxidoreductase